MKTPFLNLSKRTARRYEEAVRLMDELMNEEHIDDERFGRSNLRIITVHLDAIAMSPGNFLKEYFGRQAKAPETVVETTEFKCVCGRPFATSQALSGHQPHCELKKGRVKK